jgi:hypothetical protein
MFFSRHKTFDGDLKKLPFDMFDVARSDAEARSARRLESIYHVGQQRIWNGREVLAQLIAKHGAPTMAERERNALARIFSIIMWGELGAWKISAQLADVLVPLEAKLAAASQVHDEARHFYVMHDYLEALAHRPKPMDRWSRRTVELTLATESLPKKLLGMQLTIEPIALTIFQLVRDLKVEPVLTELLPYYERDEARHVGLGVQLMPQLIKQMSLPERLDLAVFELDLLLSVLLSVKAMQPDLESIGVDPRRLLAIGFRKHQDVNESIREHFPDWPVDPPVKRIFSGLVELMFPKDDGKTISYAARIAQAIQVMRRARTSVLDEWATKMKTEVPRDQPSAPTWNIS